MNLQLSAGALIVSPRRVYGIPKNPREECPHLLAMARDKPCLFRWARGCRGDDGSTTVACHENGLGANKGLGYKAHDWRSAWGCHCCHQAYDRPLGISGPSRSAREAAFDRAWTWQLREWRKIAASPLSSAADATAARWALERAVAFLSRSV
jgi:hypothetical protein